MTEKNHPADNMCVRNTQKIQNKTKKKNISYVNHKSFFFFVYSKFRMVYIMDCKLRCIFYYIFLSPQKWS